MKQTSTRGLGLTVDIQADAPLTAQNREAARCRIELKGNWNPHLLNAMRTQLAEDYLAHERDTAGIYVTAWFDPDLWNDQTSSADYRRAARTLREATERKLAEQAQDLRYLGMQVRSVIIDVPRPKPSSRRRTRIARTRRPREGDR